MQTSVSIRVGSAQMLVSVQCLALHRPAIVCETNLHGDGSTHHAVGLCAGRHHAHVDCLLHVAAPEQSVRHASPRHHLLLRHVHAACHTITCVTCGSFHIWSIFVGSFFEINSSFKLGRFVDIYHTNINAKFQLCKWNGFRDMTMTNAEERSFFAPTPHIKTTKTPVLIRVETRLRSEDCYLLHAALHIVT